MAKLFGARAGGFLLGPMRTRSTAARLLLLVIGSSTAPKSTTRHDGKPPGWRPDQPAEHGGEIVERMQRSVGLLGMQPGLFFDEYRRVISDMAAMQEDLRPATLKAANDHTTMTESLRATLERGQKAMEWQRAGVERLEASAWARSRKVSDWTAKEMASLLSTCDVFSMTSSPQDDKSKPVPKLSKGVRQSILKGMATDLVAVLYTFWWTHENMPDDEEAKEITAQTNKDLGYPSPSQPPTMPPQAAPRQDKKAPRPRKDKAPSQEEMVRTEAARQRASKLDPATAETEGLERIEQLVGLLRGLRLGGRKQLPEGTSVRLASTPLEITLEDDVRMHALFTTRRFNRHDPDIIMDAAVWEKNLGFTSAELSALAEHGVAPYQDEAWTLAAAYMGYKQYYDPTDDFHLEGMLWLGKARDPSLVYRGQAEFKNVRGKDGKMHWTASMPKDVVTERKQQPRRKKRRQKTEL